MDLHEDCHRTYRTAGLYRDNGGEHHKAFSGRAREEIVC